MVKIDLEWIIVLSNFKKYFTKIYLLSGTSSFNLIGWRPDARRVIIVITDEEMHYAMDGILAGILKPFDMKCHSTMEDGYNSQQKILDFPSFGQVSLKTLINKYFSNSCIIQ